MHGTLFIHGIAEETDEEDTEYQEPEEVSRTSAEEAEEQEPAHDHKIPAESFSAKR